MTLKDEKLVNFVSGLENANEEMKERANRPFKFDSNTSFKPNAKTVILSNELKTIQSTINKETVKYPGFAVAFYDNNGQLLDTGTISANSFLREFYPQQGSAANAELMVTNRDEFGETPQEIVNTIFEKGLMIEYLTTKPMYAARFNRATNSMNYDTMIHKERHFFKIVPMSEDLKAKL